jgi:hypothetical protein
MYSALLMFVFISFSFLFVVKNSFLELFFVLG